MKKALLAILFASIFTTTFSQGNAPVSYELAKVTFKDGTSKDMMVEMSSPMDMQQRIIAFDAKLQTSGGNVSEKQKQRFWAADLKEVKTKRKTYEVKKYPYLNTVGIGALGKAYILEVFKGGPITLYRFYSNNKPAGELLIGKSDDKVRAVSTTPLFKYIEDISVIAEKFKSGGYGNNPKNDNAILNDNLSFIEKLVAEYNEAAAYGKLLSEAEKTSLKKINQLIIFQLYINYELSQRNGNLAILMDYVPSDYKRNFRKIQMTSNYAFENEKSTFTYGYESELLGIVYEREDKRYEYDFNYANGRPESVNIARKKKIEFVYNYDTLKSIVREHNGTVAEYEIKYLPGQQKANIQLYVVNQGKRQAAMNTYFVAWNNEYQITQFSFDMFASTGMTHSDNGGLASFTTRDVDGKEVVTTWEYVNDNKNNWTERKFDKYSAKRIIEYVR